MKPIIFVGIGIFMAVVVFWAGISLAQQPKSDLPPEWEEPVEVPAGAVRLEDVGSSRGSVPTTPPGAVQPPAPDTGAEPYTGPSPAAPAAQPPSGTIAGAGPAYVPPSAVGVSDSRSLPVDWSKAPPKVRGGVAAGEYAPPAPESQPPVAPPPAEPLQPTPQTYQGTKSDLPPDWGAAEPAELPAGAVRLEDVKSPYGAYPPPGSEEYTPPVSQQPMAQPPPPQAPDEREIIEGEEEEKAKKPPSRWEGR